MRRPQGQSRLSGCHAGTVSVSTSLPPVSCFVSNTSRPDLLRLSMILSENRSHFSGSCSLSYQHTATLRWQFQKDLLALRDVLVRGGDHAQLGAVGKFDHIVAAVAKE